MFQNNLKRALIDICLAISIAFSVYYLTTTHFAFMLSLFHYRMFNVPAISYTLMRIIQILLPLFLLVPAVRIRKIKRIKLSFLVTGIFYLLGNTWIIYMIMDNQLGVLNDAEALQEYLQLSALNFDYLVWDSYDLYGILFSTIQAIFYFCLTYYIDKRKEFALVFYWITLALSIIFPFIYVFLISGIGAFSTLWLQKNTILFTSGIFMGAAMSVASTSHSLWGEVIWG